MRYICSVDMAGVANRKDNHGQEKKQVRMNISFPDNDMLENDDVEIMTSFERVAKSSHLRFLSSLIL